MTKKQILGLAGGFGFLGTLLVAAAGARADTTRINDPYTPTCGLSYFSDSFGLGIEAAVSGRAVAQPKYFDEGCYELGVQHAQDEMARADSASGCQSDFADGRREGSKASSLGTGSACYALGYQAGRAALDIGAREGDTASVGQACVDLYRQGSEDNRAGRAGVSPGRGAKLDSCYQLGLFEGFGGRKPASDLSRVWSVGATRPARSPDYLRI